MLGVAVSEFDSPESSEVASPDDRGTTASFVSREIVQLHARLYGRGPTKAKTYVHEDYVLCVLEDVYTPAERTLVAAGNTAQVEASRRAFQEAVSEEFVSIVERATERRVRAFVSQIHHEPELSAELFMLEPRDEFITESNQASESPES